MPDLATPSLKEGTLIAFETAVADVFERLKATVHERWPKAHFTMSRMQRAEFVSRVASVLHSGAGEAVEFEYEWSDVEGKLWLNATMYIGQSTFIDLSSSCWSTPGTAEDELSTTVQDFAKIVLPRFVAACELVRKQDSVPGAIAD